ncbi:Ger(x)C family spore germination protein [Alicyclobacillus fodiniaquatilis]|uniref:Ger(X)C family spore germination protein n=1 Tax=Alicyclobacillus fodiniaquatilis TaxID=1661150 RepID=A0ABW4JD16_9BACL
MKRANKCPWLYWLRWRRIHLLCITCLCALFSTGCWDEHELEHMFYIHAIGVDYQKGQYVLYAQILNPLTLSKESAKAGPQTGAWIGTGVGSTVQLALHDIYSTTQRRIYWGHLSSIVIGEHALAQQGIQETLDTFTRYNELRYTPWIFCTNDSVNRVLSAEPILESSPVYSLLSDPGDVSSQSSWIPPFRLYRAISNLQEPARPHLLPEISLVEKKWRDEEDGSNPELEISGYGLLRDGKMLGRLTHDELKGFRWLTPRTRRTIVALYDKGKFVATLTLGRPKKHIHPILGKRHLQFDVDVSVGGTVSEMRQFASEKQLETLAAEQIEQDIRDTFQNGVGLGVDIYGLADSLYRRNPQAFHHDLTNEGRLVLTSSSLRHVQVQVFVHDTGMTTEPATRFNS